MANTIAKALSMAEKHLTNEDILIIRYMADKYGTSFDVLVANILRDWCDDADADVQLRVEQETRP